MRSIVVVSSRRDWDFPANGVEVVEARAYLTDSRFAEIKSVRIFNLCRSYRYQSTGYYVSLLAEARGHRAIPGVASIQDLKSQSISRIISEDIDDVIQKSLSRVPGKTFELDIYFGRNPDRQLDRLGTSLYNLFQVPFMRASLAFSRKWLLQNLNPVPVNEIPAAHRSFAMDAAHAYFARKRVSAPRIASPLFDLAVLVNPEEKVPPSDRRALKLFMEAGEDLGIRLEQINRDDFSRIAEFDALFIRETTAVHHHTYRFSRRAFAEGLVVIDDPRSILKCANKVYLAELLSRARVPIPKTVIVHRDNQQSLERLLGLPCVLKEPDSSFSMGVIRVDDPARLKEEVARLLETSDLVIAQEYVPTPFDWRIGVLDREPLFACKYFMAKGHWQIYNWQDKRGNHVGDFEPVPVYKVPKPVLKAAVKAANLIGDGLYGVDLKQVEGEVRVIEINDNPSIESGVEDQILGAGLYRAVMRSFRDRMERIRRLEEIPL